MKGAPIDKALCEYLKQYRRGQESAASSKELEAEIKSWSRKLYLKLWAAVVRNAI